MLVGDETAFGVYTSDYDLTDGRLTVRRTLTIAPGRAPAAQKGEVAALLHAIGDDAGTKVGIRRLDPRSARTVAEPIAPVVERVAGSRSDLSPYAAATP